MLDNLKFVTEISDDANQRHTIEKDGGNVVIDLVYHPQIESWTLDVQRNDKQVYGVRLANGVRLIPSQNMGVDFLVISDDDIDPFQVSDFQSGRSRLVIADVV